MQECSNSGALAMELLQSCTKLSIWADFLADFAGASSLTLKLYFSSVNKFSRNSIVTQQR